MMRASFAMLRRFRRDEAGTLLAETVIVLPMMLWAFLALFVYWDAYRSDNTSQKAAYTVSDMITRETVDLPAVYPTGMRNLVRYLVDNDQSVKLRVTSFTWSQANTRYEVDWSRSPDNAMPALTTTTIQDVKSQIPVIADGDHYILVETEVSFHPAFNVGIDDLTMKEFIVTRIRFVPKLCLIGVACS